MKLAVTGQPGSGKSTVCRILAEAGAEVVSTDQLTHQLLDPQTECGQSVIDLLGKEVLYKGKFVRERIAQIVFNDRSKLEKLEKLIHPRILEEIERRYQKTEAVLFVVEVPLLFECGWEGYFDKTILVVSNRKNPFPQRDWRFLPEGEKRSKADVIIENYGSLEELRKQVQKLITTR